jgi:PAS domain S-box-containing protein
LLSDTHQVTNHTSNGYVPTDYVALFSSLFAYTSDAVCLVGLEDGILLDVNRSFLQHFELTRAEAIGRRVTALGIWLQDEDRGAVEQELRDRGRIEDYRTRMLSRKGKELDVSVSAALAQWRGQMAILGIGAVLVDG